MTTGKRQQPAHPPQVPDRGDQRPVEPGLVGRPALGIEAPGLPAAGQQPRAHDSALPAAVRH